MNAISASELASIQSEAALAACDLTCTIKRRTRTPNAQGGASTTYNMVTTTTCGMSSPTAGQLQNFNYLVADKATWQVKFPGGTNVQEQDQVVVNGETLTVDKVLTPRSYPALLTVLASEVK